MQTIIVFILVLSLLVFVHELGHFIFAKRAGILVREFAIGFGPKIYAKLHNETLYSIRILPLGGFVRMAGEDAETTEIKNGARVYLALNQAGEITDVYLFESVSEIQRPLHVCQVVQSDLEKELFILILSPNGKEIKYPFNRRAIIHIDDKNKIQIAPLDRQFGSKSVLQKALTIVAGPLFNILFSIVLFSVYTGMIGIEDRLPVERVLPDKPASRAGLQPGDQILAINRKEIHTMDALRYQLMESKGKKVSITVQREGKKIDFFITPEKKGELYQIGAIFHLDQMKRKATFGEALMDGFRKTYEWSGIILDGFSKLITGQISIKSLGGPVQMGDITGKAAEAGIEALVKWTALLSLNLAIFNLLPIPALDGSRLVFIGLEAIRGRPIHPNKESFVHFLGFALLVMLMLVVTFNDIKKIFFT